MRIGGGIRYQPFRRILQISLTFGLFYIAIHNETNHYAYPVTDSHFVAECAYFLSI